MGILWGFMVSIYLYIGKKCRFLRVLNDLRHEKKGDRENIKPHENGRG